MNSDAMTPAYGSCDGTVTEVERRTTLAIVQAMSVRAVLFDLGGVVLESPMAVIAEHEAEAGAPPGFINRVVADAGPSGAWARHEQGRIRLDAFAEAFEAECAERGHAVDARKLLKSINQAAVVRPVMLQAVTTLRAAGYLVGALTNNWLDFGPGESLSAHFDVFVESAREGVNKPDRRIYEIALGRLGVDARHVVFLDDVGRNLKTAALMGMLTIRVDTPEAALDELSTLVSVRLR